MHVLIYWLARTALMFCVFVLLWGLGWQPWFAVAGAAVIAWLIAYSMFGSMHDAAAKQMESWVSRRFVGARGDEIAEDAEVEDAGAEDEEPEARFESKPAAKSTPKPTARVTTKPGSASAPRRPR